MRYAHCLRLLVVSLGLASCGRSEPVLGPASPSPSPPVSVIPERDKTAITLPPPPILTSAGQTLLLSTGGHELVLEFETGGRSGYNPLPEWPVAASGVTVGIGYDCGYYSRGVILSDWQALIDHDKTRLAATSGVTGQRAKAKVMELRDIFVRWAIAVNVFDTVDVAREFASAKLAMPGFEDLRPNAQAALISLGFNRGWGMSGPNRVEMRAIRDLVPSRDYEGIANQLRKMVHVWAGTSIERGMTRRRFAEAALVETQ